MMIDFRNLSLEIGAHPILQKVNLKIAGGEFVAVVGESGAGKSSLLKILIGEHRPTAGQILVDGVDIATLTPKYLQLYRRKIAVVFQDFKLLPQKTVAENIGFVLEACEHSDGRIAEIVQKVLEMVGLQKKARKFPHELSGGEQQRVAIARALANEPALLIADEPTGNLDNKNAREIMAILDKVNQRGVTVVLTTHQTELLLGIPKVRRVEIRGGKTVK